MVAVSLARSVEHALVRMTIKTEATVPIVPDQIHLAGRAMGCVTRLTNHLIFYTPQMGAAHFQNLRNRSFDDRKGMVTRIRPTVFIRVTHAAHSGIPVRCPQEYGLLAARLALDAMGGMAGGTLNLAVFIKGEYLWYLHIGRRLHICFVALAVDQARP